MKTWHFTVDVKQTLGISVTAETEEEARARWTEGEWDHDFQTVSTNLDAVNEPSWDAGVENE